MELDWDLVCSTCVYVWDFANTGYGTGSWVMDRMGWLLGFWEIDERREGEDINK
jgi:hypothetical protein